MNSLPKLKNFLEKLKAAVYPENITCDLCGKELFGKERGAFCAECRKALPIIKGRICAFCGVPMDNDATYCDRCQNSKSVLTKNRAALEYTDEARRMIYGVKFGGKRYLLKDLAVLMTDTYLSEGFTADVLTYVPMTIGEKRTRGFNQSEILAEEIATRLKLPVSDELTKIRNTKAQKKLTAKERAANLEGAFRVTNPDAFKNKDVVIVDDVYTTGATLSECASVLRKAGAKSVSGLTACITKYHVAGETAKSDEKGQK